MAELKFIFTGSPGVGKTTAIRAISEFDPVSTDVPVTDELAALKGETTAAMDFGELTLGDGQKLRLYGTPGQERFRFMWDILTRGALGLIILVDNSRPEPLKDLADYLDSFSDFIEQSGVVVGVTRLDSHPNPSIEKYYSLLGERDIAHPLFPTDIRRKEDVSLLLNALMSSLEYR